MLYVCGNFHHFKFDFMKSSTELCAVPTWLYSSTAVRKEKKTFALNWFCVFFFFLDFSHFSTSCRSKLKSYMQQLISFGNFLKKKVQERLERYTKLIESVLSPEMHQYRCQFKVKYKKISEILLPADALTSHDELLKSRRHTTACISHFPQLLMPRIHKI